MIRTVVENRFARFVLAGGIAAAVNFGSRIVLNRWVSFSSAVILAYIVGMITAFVLNRALVFGRGQQSTTRSVTYFVLVNLVAVIQTWAISLLLADYILPAMGVTRGVREIAHAFGVIVPVVTSYVGHKRLSFR